MDHRKPGRYIAITGEGKAFSFTFPHPKHDSFEIEGDQVLIKSDRTPVTAEWYYLNEISLYHTLELCVPENTIPENTIWEAQEVSPMEVRYLETEQAGPRRQLRLRLFRRVRRCVTAGELDHLRTSGELDQIRAMIEDSKKSSRTSGELDQIRAMIEDSKKSSS